MFGSFMHKQNSMKNAISYAKKACINVERAPFFQDPRVSSESCLEFAQNETFVRLSAVPPVVSCHIDSNKHFRTFVVLQTCAKLKTIAFCSPVVGGGFFLDPIRVPRIRKLSSVSRSRENWVPRIREIGSLQIHTGYLTFSLKKTWYKLHQKHQRTAGFFLLLV